MVIDNIRKRISLTSSSHGAPCSANEVEDGFNGTEVSFPSMAWAPLARLRTASEEALYCQQGPFQNPTRSHPSLALYLPSEDKREVRGSTDEARKRNTSLFNLRLHKTTFVMSSPATQPRRKDASYLVAVAGQQLIPRNLYLQLCRGPQFTDALGLSLHLDLFFAIWTLRV